MIVDFIFGTIITALILAIVIMHKIIKTHKKNDVLAAHYELPTHDDMNLNVGDEIECMVVRKDVYIEPGRDAVTNISVQRINPNPVPIKIKEEVKRQNIEREEFDKIDKRKVLNSISEIEV